MFKAISAGTIVVFLMGTGAAIAQQRPAGRGAARPAAAAAAPAPHLSVAGIRVVGTGLGANASELRPFNESPGTTVTIAIESPKGSGIVEIDDDASRLDSFADDKGQTLLEEGRVGPFPKVAEDGSAALVEVETRGRPSPGSASVTVQGTLSITMASGSKPVRVPAVKLQANQAFKVGATTMTIKEASADDESTKINIGLPRSILNSIREVRFFDAANAAIDAHRSSSGYMNEKAEMEYELKTKDKTATIEFELWQNSRTVKVPFNLQAGLGSVGGRSAQTSDSAPPQAPTAAAPVKPAGPPPAVGPGDGATTVEAVVKQMQTAAAAGKGGDVLAVIHPSDRAAYAQAVAMTLTFAPMGIDDKKAGEKMQKELDDFFAKHQLKPPFARDPADLFKGIDLAAFVSDSFAFLKSHAQKGEKPEYPVPPGSPENVKTTGDTAVATISGKDVKFDRISGRWFIRLE